MLRGRVSSEQCSRAMGEKSAQTERRLQKHLNPGNEEIKLVPNNMFPFYIKGKTTATLAVYQLL